MNGWTRLRWRRIGPPIAVVFVSAAVVVGTVTIGGAAAPVCFVAMIAVVFTAVRFGGAMTVALGVAVCASAVAVAQLATPSAASHAGAIGFFEVLLVVAPALVGAVVRMRRTLAQRLDATGGDPGVAAAARLPDFAAIETGLLDGVGALRQVGEPVSAAQVERLEQIARATLAAMRAHVHQLRVPPSAEEVSAASISALRDRVDLLIAATTDADVPMARFCRRTLPPTRLVDFSLTVAALGLAVAAAVGRPGLQALVAALTALPLVAARRALFPVALASCIAVVVFTALHHPVDPLGGLPTVALQIALPLLAGAVLRSAQGIAALLTCLATTAVLPLSDGDHYPVADVCGALGVEIAVALLALAINRSLLQLQVATDAGWQRRETARAVALSAVEEQRRTVARELHDAIAHSLTVVVLHASAARRTWVVDEGRRDTHLGVIHTAVQQTLTALIDVLGRLRGDAAASDDAPSTPSVAAICREAEAAGLRVTIHGASALASLPELGGQLGYRVVREALTNAMRHAPSSQVVIDVVRCNDSITIGVVNSPPVLSAGESLGTGSGLQGLRERLAAVGGVLDADPTPSGGFRVTATMPIPEPSA